MRELPRNASLTKGLIIGVSAIVLLGVLIVGWSLIEARLLFTSRAVVTNPEIPESFNGAKIVFVADIHSGTLLGAGHMNKIIDRVMAEKPDLIIIGGDSIGGGERGSVMFYPAAKRLKAPLGVISVLGNHEGRWGADRARADLTADNILVLENEHARVIRGGDSIAIAGVADLLTGRPDLRAAASGLSKDGYTILVSHNPDALPKGLPTTKGAFDLALAGHTHGGQITLFGLWAPFVPSEYGQRFRGGWSTVDGVPTLVSRGAGAFMIPMRFFAPPEINVITLRRGKANVSH